jgi:hypothetical protein
LHVVCDHPQNLNLTAEAVCDRAIEIRVVSEWNRLDLPELPHRRYVRAESKELEAAVRPKRFLDRGAQVGDEAIRVIRPHAPRPVHQECLLDLRGSRDGGQAQCENANPQAFHVAIPSWSSSLRYTNTNDAPKV